MIVNVILNEDDIKGLISNTFKVGVDGINLKVTDAVYGEKKYLITAEFLSNAQFIENDKEAKNDNS